MCLFEMLVTRSKEWLKRKVYIQLPCELASLYTLKKTRQVHLKDVT